MEENTDHTENSERSPGRNRRENHGRRRHKQPRPTFLSVICIIAFVFYGLITFLFLLALFFSGWIARVRNTYIPDGTDSKLIIIAITAGGFILHLVSLIGSINIWFRRKSGYIMFSVSTLIIALFQLFSDRISVFTTSVYVCFILLFGIYYRRFH